MKAIALTPQLVENVLTNSIRVIIRDEELEVVNKDFMVIPCPGRVPTASEQKNMVAQSPGSLYFYDMFVIENEQMFSNLFDFHKMSNAERVGNFYDKFPLYAYAFRFRPFSHRVVVDVSEGIPGFLVDVAPTTDSHISLGLLEDPMNYDPRQVDNALLIDDLHTVMGWFNSGSYRSGIEPVKVGTTIVREILKRGVELQWLDYEGKDATFITNCLAEVKKKHMYAEYMEVNHHKESGMDRILLSDITDQSLLCDGPLKVSVIGDIVHDGYTEGDVHFQIHSALPDLPLEVEILNYYDRDVWNRIHFCYDENYIKDSIPIYSEFQTQDFIAYPFKYLGSKRGMMKQLIENTPSHITTVVDGFMGSGVVSYYYRKHGLNVVGCDISNISGMIFNAIIGNKEVKLDETEISGLISATPQNGHVSTLGIQLDSGCRKFIDGYNIYAASLSPEKQCMAKSALLSSLSNMFFNGLLGSLHVSVPQKMKKYKISMTGVLQAGLKRWLNMYNDFVVNEGGTAKFMKGDLATTLSTLQGNALAETCVYLDPPYITESLPYSAYTLYDKWEEILFGGMEEEKDGSKWNMKNFLEKMGEVLEPCRNVGMVMVSYKVNKTFPTKMLEKFFHKYFTNVTTKVIPFTYTFKRNEGAKELLFLMSNQEMTDWEYKTSNFEDFTATTNTPSWGSISKTKENFPNKSDFIIQRGDDWSDWKLPYKHNGKIHCGGVRAVASAVGGARSGSSMSLTPEEQSRFNGAKSACNVGKDKKELELLENGEYVDVKHPFTETTTYTYTDKFLEIPERGARFSLKAHIEGEDVFLHANRWHGNVGVSMVHKLNVKFESDQSGFGAVKSKFFTEIWPQVKASFLDTSIKMEVIPSDDMDYRREVNGQEGYTGSGYDILLDHGDVEFLTQTPYIHELVYHGRYMNGKFMERLMMDEGIGKWQMYRNDDIPFVLSQQAVSENWVPEHGHSGLSLDHENEVPELYTYWKQETKAERVEMRNDLTTILTDKMSKVNLNLPMPLDSYFTLQYNTGNPDTWNFNVLYDESVYSFVCDSSPLVTKTTAMFNRRKKNYLDFMNYDEGNTLMIDKGTCEIKMVKNNYIEIEVFGELMGGKIVLNEEKGSGIWMMEMEETHNISYMQFQDFTGEIIESEETKGHLIIKKGILFRPGDFKGTFYDKNVVSQATLNPIHRGTSMAYLNYFHNRDELSRIGVITNIWWDATQEWTCAKDGSKHKGALMFDGVITNPSGIEAVVLKGTFHVSAEVAFDEKFGQATKMVITGGAICHSPAVDAAQIMTACYSGGKCYTFPTGITPAST